MNHKRFSGFTVVEIMIVVVVISIIASMTLVGFNQAQIDSRDRERVADVTALKSALTSFYRDNNEYPAPCANGISCNGSLLDSFLVPKYIPSIPKDPKGNEYNYIYDTTYDADGYGLYVQFEGPPGNCKTGIDVRTTWWSSVAMCPANVV